RPQLVPIDVAPGTARRAVRQVASARSEPGGERRADRAADTVEDDVERAVELISPSVVAVVDRSSRAEFASAGELAGVTRKCDDRRTRIGSELDKEAADATGSGGDDRGLTRADLRRSDQPE